MMLSCRLAHGPLDKEKDDTGFYRMPREQTHAISTEKTVATA